MGNAKLVLIVGTVSVVLIAGLLGCQSLKASKPLFEIAEYEQMIVGRLDANYVGTARCLAACHEHDRLRRDFEASTMGAQMSSDVGMPLVNCETCHGPGSLAIEGITKESVEADAAKGIKTKCNNDTLLHLHDLPKPALSLICLKCHTANATFNLHNWNAGAHGINDVACSDCHDIHAGSDLVLHPRDIKDVCLKCHQRVKAEFTLRSHHPVMEGKVFCTSCHDPHDSINEKQKREDSVRETCTRCHAEYRGPFLYEHADLTEDCLRCHRSHGSPNASLLVAQETFICLQCHSGHTATGSSESRKVFYSRCTDCHSRIHGTDLPSEGGGTFLH